MPIVAEAPPITIGMPGSEGGQVERTPAPKPARTPKPRTPRPTATPMLPDISAPSGDFVQKHGGFISSIESRGCFKREDLPDFTDQEFSDHVAVAMQDKYISQTKDTYCTMEGIKKMVASMRRASSVEELI